MQRGNWRLVGLLGVALALGVTWLVLRGGREPSPGNLMVQARSGTAEERVEAIRELSRAAVVEQVSALAELAQDANTQVATEAVRAIGRWGGAPVVEPLKKSYGDPRPEVREQVMVALGEVGDRSVGAFLQEAAEKDASAEVQASASSALGRVRYVDAMPTLLKLLEHPSERVRRSAAASIRRIWTFDHGFKADDPPEKRRSLAAAMRHHWDIYCQSEAYQALRQNIEEGP